MPVAASSLSNNLFFEQMTMEPRHDKTCLRGPNHVRHISGCTTTEDGKRFNVSDMDEEGHPTLCSENKGADKLRCSTAQLICAFVLAYSKSRFLMTRLICFQTNRDLLYLSRL